MAFSHTSLFDSPARRTIPWSINHRKKHQLNDPFIDRLDITDFLGDQDASGRILGHTGCVNALSWSPSGQLLASGSDDRDVCLWKIGSDHVYPSIDPRILARNKMALARHSDPQQDLDPEAFPSVVHDDHGQRNSSSSSSHSMPDTSADTDAGGIAQVWPERSYPDMGLGMLGKIQTGHRANIFSVKWAPNASERRLFTCAGDSHVRVFDINYMSTTSDQASGGAEASIVRTSPGREYSVWNEDSGACIRVFRCHRGRAKRISTEVSPDVFLTCGEDGDVRQMDLRVPHTCRSPTGGSCPPPLAHYPWVLYSLSLSKLEPWLFAVAGDSSLAYLHDRRMIPRLIKRDWGMSFSNEEQQDALTMCVRAFGIPRGGFSAPLVQSDGRTALVDVAPRPANRHFFNGNCNSITACKLSEYNGRDLLVSYSSGHIHRFDIYDEPGIVHANLDKARNCPDSPEEASTVESEDEEPRTDVDQVWDKRSNTAEQSTHGPNLFSQGETTEAGHVDIEAEKSDDDEEYDVESEDPDMEQDEYGDGDFSDEDLVHLLEEDEQEQMNLDLGASRDVPIVYPRTAYRGHRNAETVKDVAFAGGADNYVVSGSDDGNWFMWDKLTSEIKGIWHADTSVVNVMAMHPELPVFAISGIDESIKIFAPISHTPCPPLPSPAEAPTDITDTGTSRKRARTNIVASTRAHRIADRLMDKDDICRMSEGVVARNRPIQLISRFWRPRAHSSLGSDDDDEGRLIEGDCIVM
ncbi:hypothetical protein EX895_005749 [Sporisorium graminicola]|uniref:Anaphase-promoting complex subunit 4 WD40 domain-containing protein n=1 Tax=Sporisorium graminicola TaxID=280036 RepID=A0A4U7KP59_9BASI|nr:hypothetical protein EX895_005749 [Sporisorium graminicola]TKY85587.1 hypothetical protein EX895_005749 [Sporisorium graminicola]